VSDATRSEQAIPNDPYSQEPEVTTTSSRPAPAQSRAKAWVLLLLAASLEIIFALATGATEGFTVLWPSLIAIVAVAGSIYFLTKALKTLDVGVGYTVWTGIGSVGTVLLGVVIFGESLSLAKIVCFVLIIGGVIGLQQSDRKPKPATPPVESVADCMAVRCGGTAAQPVANR
jgi:quaternary ammonium compound-resistance protein SugE